MEVVLLGVFAISTSLRPLDLQFSNLLWPRLAISCGTQVSTPSCAVPKRVQASDLAFYPQQSCSYASCIC